MNGYSMNQRLLYLKEMKKHNDERIAQCKEQGERLPNLRDFFDGLIVGRLVFDQFLRSEINDLEASQ